MSNEERSHEDRAWENWRFQVDSGWNRSNYFAVVETVALAGAWQVLDQSTHPKTALFFAFLGLLSTIIWLLNDLINHTYISFWWLSAIPKRKDWYDDEAKKLGIGRWWSERLGVKYSHLMHVIPIIFSAAWLWMLALFIPSPRSCYVLAMAGGLALTWGLLAISKKVGELIEKSHAPAK
jgi:hypothetical protein